MRHNFYLLLLFVLFCFGGHHKAVAQGNQGKRLQFVYIDHEVTTPTDVLNERMVQRLYEVGEFPDSEAMIIYLSNGRRSPISLVNIKEYLSAEQLAVLTASGQPRDTGDAFMKVLETMNNANSHDVEARMDINNILNLFEQLHVFDDTGKLNFKALRMDFYVGPKFWLQRNNEKVIARLYALLQQGLQDADKDRITFNVFKPTGTQLDYPEGKPFGETNINGINEKLTIMEY